MTHHPRCECEDMACPHSSMDTPRCDRRADYSLWPVGVEGVEPPDSIMVCEPCGTRMQESGNWTGERPEKEEA